MKRFAYDSYRRLIQMYGNVVLDIPKAEFEEVFDGQKHKRGVKLDTELTAADLQEVIAQYKEVVRKHTKQDFPQNPVEQLVGARNAVSAHGTTIAQKFTAALTTSLMIWERPSTSRPWCLAIWARPAEPAWALRAIRRTATKNFMASS